MSISLSDVQAAAKRIQPYVLRTPTIHCEKLARELGCNVYFKAENLQHIGAFKARGAINAVLQLDDDAARCGVVTHSSGNHAAALSRAASIRKIPAHVVMPKNSAINKIEAVRSFGVEPVFCEPSSEAREIAAGTVQQQTGAALIHPFDNLLVMAGQGTVGLEIVEQVQNLDAIFVPVGGGGLLSGVLAAVKQLCPRLEVYAAEPAWADDAARSLESGKIESPIRYDTIADGLRSNLGVHTFPVIQQLVDGIVLVSEKEIENATRTITQGAHLVAEPSGAVAYAALVKSAHQFQNKNVCAIISGGNIDWGK